MSLIYHLPTAPERYIEAITVCERARITVVIIDSITHEWNGSGGCLDIHEKLGGRFQDWAIVTPRHQAFIDKILQSECHIITTTRRKIEYDIDRDASGKLKIQKLGTKEITKEGYEYELTVNFELINENHLVRASKDRTGLFMNKPEFIINSTTGKKILEWCNSGTNLQDAREKIKATSTVDELKVLYNQYSNWRELLEHDFKLQKDTITTKELLLNPKAFSTNGSTNHH
ncbi:AAA family ATPase [Flavobacterium sp.]|uniref:AAA family ATPase n=1 Tax=Flavobacterium sp. TaxID=239 RepID=UPI00262EA506|nr:AAA family ATPase [Flavobacterium sp.]